MKALSLFQPWASLMAVGAKTIETRGRTWAHRGDFAVHAGRHCEGFLLNDGAVCRALGLSMEPSAKITLPAGAIVCVVELYADEDAMMVAHELMEAGNCMELKCGDYSMGHRAWRTRNLRKLRTPVRCPGHQGIWNLAPEIEAAVKAQIL